MVVMSDRVVEASSESASKAKGSTGAGVLLGINLSIDLVPRVWKPMSDNDAEDQYVRYAQCQVFDLLL
jgi:hypothetical protein